MMQYSQAKLRKNDCRDDLASFVGFHPGVKARIAKIRNKEAAWPILIPNPKLDDPNNWIQSFGVPLSHANIPNARFLNATEEDLTLHWTISHNLRYCTKCEVEYTIGMHNDPKCPTCGGYDIVSVHRLVRLSDDPDRWIWFWKPRPGTPYRIPDPSVEFVYVVVYDEESARG